MTPAAETMRPGPDGTVLSDQVPVALSAQMAAARRQQASWRPPVATWTWAACPECAHSTDDWECDVPPAEFRAGLDLDDPYSVECGCFVSLPPERDHHD